MFIFNILFFIYIGNFDVFSHVLIFSIKTFISFSDGLTFAKFVEFFLIFQPKDMLDLRNSANLLINIMLIKRRVHLHSTLTQTILVVNYILINYPQALTSELPSNVRSRTPILQYLFLHVLPDHIICIRVDEAENILHAFL